jgi:hypothetical protein
MEILNTKGYKDILTSCILSMVDQFGDDDCIGSLNTKGYMDILTSCVLSMVEDQFGDDDCLYWKSKHKCIQGHSDKLRTVYGTRPVW